MHGRRMAWLALALVLAFVFAIPQVWASGGKETGKKEVTIGVSVGDLRLERWKRDVDYMTQAATKLGAKVYATSADGDSQKQISQIENMLTEGVNVPHHHPGRAAGSWPPSSKRRTRTR